MIVILKRDDLPHEHRDLAGEALELDRSQLPFELVDQAELIGFVEGDSIKFLKHREDIQSKESFEVRQSYTRCTPPTYTGCNPYGARCYRRKRKE